MAAAANPIRPELFGFLRELERHNDRVWFAANKQRYLDVVRDPLLRFIADLEAREVSSVDVTVLIAVGHRPSEPDPGPDR